MTKTLRLLMPQWQGGNNPPYFFGAKLLACLAPDSDNALQVEVPVEPYGGTALPNENGVVARTVLLQQLKSAHNLLDTHQPDRVIVFGGDCHVSQAPFAYLNEKYEGKLGVLWLDAHPDVSTPNMHKHEHAMVLGNLLGEGDPVLAAEVKTPLQPELVMYGGLQEPSSAEAEIVNRLNLRKAGPKELAGKSDAILDWIAQYGIEHLAIHLDLDVLDPSIFRSLLSSQPGSERFSATNGEMTLTQVARVIQDVSQKTDIVGLAIAEYLPWDAINLHSFMDSLPIFH